MELDLTGYPVGGYGVVIYDGHNKLDVFSVLSTLQYNILSINCETIDGKKTTCLIDEFLDIFTNPSICIKMFHMSETSSSLIPYEEEKSVFRSLHSRLTLKEMTQYTPIAHVNVNNVDVSFIQLNLETPVVLKLGNGQKSQPHSKLFCIVNTKFDGNYIKVEHIEPIKKTLWFLNTKGIFHRDVKFENIMTFNGEPRLVDFGSVRIDDGRKDILQFYNSTRYVHPFINYYFKNEISDRAKEHTIGRDLIPKFQCEFKRFVDDNRNEKYFTQYMLHKKDCFDFAMWCINTQAIKDKVYNHTIGGFFSCFKTQFEYMEIRDILNSKYTILAPFIYMDRQDFLNFRDEYQKQMSQYGGRRKSEKQYIQLRSNNKEYLVRVNKNKQKYILVNKSKVFLSNVKNKYRYIKS